MPHPDCLILGGGVIGLSLAWKLAEAGQRVQVIDQGEIGKEASWAGAGILPPVTAATAIHPYDQLRALSFETHAMWAAELRKKTGIDNGYRRCGAIYLARKAGEAAALSGWAGSMADEQVAIQRLSDDQLQRLEPGLSLELHPKVAYSLPDETQIRNPRHLRALIAICEKLGVQLTPHCGAHSFETAGERLLAVQTSQGRLSAENICLASGAWTSALLAPLGFSIGIVPIRGQILLYRCDSVPLQKIINEGPRYIVPRDDGYVLVGSTEEEAGFDKSNTPETLADLTKFATELVPALQFAVLENSWAGLRPASFDGMPYLGRLPGLSNAFIAAGHFRSGLYLSPGTTLCLVPLILQQPVPLDLTPFQLLR